MMKRFLCMLAFLVFMLSVMWLSAMPAQAQSDWRAQAWTVTEGDSIYVMLRIKDSPTSVRTMKLPVLTAFETHQRLEYIFDPASSDTTGTPPPIPPVVTNHDLQAVIRPELYKSYTVSSLGFRNSLWQFILQGNYRIQFTILPPDSL